jgi:ubiquinol-cytochrome c reductase cytochrome b subunit
VDNATLQRFFSLHYLLPFVIGVLVLVHLAILHINGSTNTLNVFQFDKIIFIPYFYVKDLFIFSIAVLFCFSVVFFMPNLINHPDNYILANPLVTPTHIVPE